MKQLTLTTLGNGGCLNHGLPYNAHLLNRHILLETPPDIMLSLSKQNAGVDTIDTVYISHFHADHTFGLPFFIINKWIESLRMNADRYLTIYGPRGIGKYAKNLIETAFTRDHPCYDWLETHTEFITISDQYETTWDHMSGSFFAVEHLISTYGLMLSDGDRPLFAYIADTKWCEKVERILSQKPEIVLMDMNGGVGNIHTSLDEVIEKGLPITGEDTMYYGTHLAEEFESDRPLIHCARPGTTITISCGQEEAGGGMPRNLTASG